MRPTMKPAMTDEKTIERKMLMPSRSVAGKRVRMAHIVRGVVHDVDVREADHADDEDAEHHSHQGLRKPPHLTGCDRQVRNLCIRELGRAHGDSPLAIWRSSNSFRATSRLVRCRLVPAGIFLRAILAPAAARKAASKRR